MDKFEADSDMELYYLCRALNRPCGREYVLGNITNQNQGPDLKLKKTSPRKILDEITKRLPGCHWVIQDGVLVIEPEKRSGKDLLANKLGYVSIHDKSSSRAAYIVFAQAKIQVGEGHNGPPLRHARVDLELRNVTVREALNAIAKADGQVMWAFTPEDSEQRIGRFFLSSWRTSGISELDEEIESCPLITRWRLALKLKWNIGTAVDMSSCQRQPDQ